MSDILALDQSTSATKALLFDEAGAVVDRTARAHAPHYPQPGWVEHDADEIYRNVLAMIHDLAARQPERIARITGLSLTNQRETVVVFDRETGEPLHPAIVWQCRRGVPVCTELAGCAPGIRAATGLPLDSYFPAPKLRRLFQDRPDIATRVRNGAARIGTIDAYLLHRLTGGRVFATDHTNASRTLLYDLHQRDWSDDLCDLFGVPRHALPEIRDCDARYGETDGAGGLPRTVPIAGVIGDSQAALYAQRCFTPGSAKATLGTGSSVLVNVGAAIPPWSDRGGEGIVTALAWVCGGRPEYALEGIINYAGATLHWLRDQLGLIADPAECEALSRSVPDNGGVYLVPAFVGMGAPYWDSKARGALVGLTPASTRAHVVRAALESIAYQIADVAAAMATASGQHLDGLSVDGGMTTSRFLMQFLADITGQRLRVATQPELSAAGAASMGQRALGIQGTLSTRDALPGGSLCYEPAADRTPAERYYAGWKAAVRTICTV